MATKLSKKLKAAKRRVDAPGKKAKLAFLAAYLQAIKK